MSQNNPNRDINNTKPKKYNLPWLQVLVVVLLAGLILFLLSVVSKNEPLLKSYKGGNSNEVYTLLEVSDTDFLNKIKFGKISEIKQLLSMGANINAVDEKGRNALGIAALFNNDPKVAKLLAQSGVNVNAKDPNGYTPMMLSALSGGDNQDFVKELINQGGDVNSQTASGISVLMVAVGSSLNEDLIEKLIKSGAKVNYKNKDGVTPLMVATKITTNPKIVEVLLKHGASKLAKDSLGVSVYEIARTNPALNKNKALMKRLKS